jgi:SOS response regulatory protein OraA/RecX
VKEIFTHALKLLAARDYTIAGLRRKLEERFGSVPQEVIDELLRKRFLNDRRYAENYVRGKRRSLKGLRDQLEARGIEPSVVDDVLSQTPPPSLQDALKATMADWKLKGPLSSRDAARLYRALARLAYDEAAIREEIEQLHDQ